MAIDLSEAKTTPAIGHDPAVGTTWVDVTPPPWATVVELRGSGEYRVGMKHNNADASPTGTNYETIPADGVESVPVGAVDELLVNADRTIRVAAASGTITVSAKAYP